MKFLVTGAPGTGKTTLVEYAHELGRENFFDTDKVEGLCEWRNYKTGEVLGLVEDVQPIGGEIWYKTNGWYWVKVKLDEIVGSVDNAVICGSADNIMDFYGDFDKIILLYKSRDDIVHNLLQPGREQANGKDPEHHDRILKWQRKLLETATPYKPVIIVDNEISLVFEKVLAEIGNK